MAASYRTAITIAQFVFFVPSMVLALYLCFHHGLKAAGTWRFIATLSALRVAGGSSYFISLSHPTINVYVAVIVCELMGLAPLMLTCVALVGRVNKTSRIIPPKSFLVITLLSLTGLIFGIVGTTHALNDASNTNDVTVNRLLKTALALFLAGYALMMFFFLYLVFDTMQHPAKRIALGTETRILTTVGLASPFVLVRLVYGALGDYTSDPKFGSLYGNNTLYLCLSVLMEICTVTICLSSAFFVPIPKEEVVEKPTELQDSNAEIASSSVAQNTSHDINISLAAQ